MRLINVLAYMGILVSAFQLPTWYFGALIFFVVVFDCSTDRIAYLRGLRALMDAIKSMGVK